MCSRSGCATSCDGGATRISVHRPASATTAFGSRGESAAEPTLTMKEEEDDLPPPLASLRSAERSEWRSRAKARVRSDVPLTLTRLFFPFNSGAKADSTAERKEEGGRRTSEGRGAWKAWQRPLGN